MSNALDFSSMLSALEMKESEGEEAAAAAPERPAAARPVAIVPPTPMTSTFTPVPASGSTLSVPGDPEVGAEQFQKLLAQARRSVQVRSGLIGMVFSHLRGDEVMRREYKAKLAELDALQFNQDAQLLMFLAFSLHKLGFQVSTKVIDEMDEYLKRFPKGGAAERVGTAILEHDIALFPKMETEITGKARGLMAGALGYNRQ